MVYNKSKHFTLELSNCFTAQTNTPFHYAQINYLNMDTLTQSPNNTQVRSNKMQKIHPTMCCVTIVNKTPTLFVF